MQGRIGARGCLRGRKGLNTFSSWPNFLIKILGTIPAGENTCAFFLFCGLNYEFNTHAHTRNILSTIDLELDTHRSHFSQECLL